MIMRSNAARGQIGQQTQKHAPTSPKAHNQTYLNRRQELLNRLFDDQVFYRTDKEFPYGSKNGQKIDDKNTAQMAAVADWILFGQRTDGQWPDYKVTLLEKQLLINRRNWIPPEFKRQLDIANKLNSILKHNEEISFQRDDAKALADGMKVLIEANTHNGKVNEQQLIKDIQLFTIDAGKYELGSIVGQAEASNAAYNLMGGPRLGTIGWKEKYWDWGKQYEVNQHGDKKLINQAHHFTFFFTKGLLAGSDAAVWVKHRGAEIIDPIGNKQDQDLGKLATDLGWQIRTGKIQWKKIPKIIYQELKE
jgi:hypothetical protein